MVTTSCIGGRSLHDGSIGFYEVEAGVYEVATGFYEVAAGLYEVATCLAVEKGVLGGAEAPPNTSVTWIYTV